MVVEAQIPAPAPTPPATEPVLVRAPSFCRNEGLSPWCFGVKTVWDVGSHKLDGEQKYVETVTPHVSWMSFLATEKEEGNFFNM